MTQDELSQDSEEAIQRIIHKYGGTCDLPSLLRIAYFRGLSDGGSMLSSQLQGWLAITLAQQASK